MPAAEALTGVQVHLVGGKGGVGKTTVAAALARLLASHGHRTLLVSTDPAHSTSDLLGVHPRRDPVPAGPRWSVLEIDAEQVAREHVARIAEDARDVVPAAVMPALRRHLDAALASPGTQESALLDRLSDVLLDAVTAGTWDRVVVDTAPTGHTLRLLTLPDLLSSWVDGLLRTRESFLRTDSLARALAREDAEPAPDPVATRLRARRDRLTAVRDLLRRESAVHLVVVPERLAVLETARARDALRAGGLPLGLLVVNRVLPSGSADPFLAAQVRGQRAWLDRIDADLGGMSQVLLPHLPEEPGPQSLDVLGAVLADALGRE
ncbi:ArsA family ATPase [Quadrisphaera sp. GCM10027208]|uniref:ArsA family ATPase n=1 Tax=Quadrisphaera sp. GCM10027208 TaxID=3273423 RepID=UPI0036180EDE